MKMNKQKIGLVGAVLSVVPALVAVENLKKIEQHELPSLHRVESINLELTELVREGFPSVATKERIDELIGEKYEITSDSVYQAQVSAYNKSLRVAQKYCYLTLAGTTALLAGSFWLHKKGVDQNQLGN